MDTKTLRRGSAAPTLTVGEARPATLNAFERKPGLDVDGSHKIDGGEEAVSAERGAATGMALEHDRIELDVEPRIDPARLSLEAFMAEELEVVMHDPAAETEPDYVELRVNGDYVIVRRDSQHPVKMRRYHVAVLAQSKTSSLRQERYVDGDGFQGYREKVVLRQSYPFAVMHDPSGSRGTAWLRPLVSGATA